MAGIVSGIGAALGIGGPSAAQYGMEQQGATNAMNQGAATQGQQDILKLLAQGQGILGTSGDQGQGLLNGALAKGQSQIDYRTNMAEGALGGAQTAATSALSPYASAGASALPGLMNATSQGFTAADFTADPGYQFTLQQGERATQNAAGVQGSPFGGAASMAMQNYASGLANQTYNNAFQRWQTQVGNMQNLAGLGQGSSSTIAGLISSLGQSNASAQSTAGGEYTGLVNSVGTAGAGLAGSLGTAGAGLTSGAGGNISQIINSLIGGNTSTFGTQDQGNTNIMQQLFGAL